MRYRLCLAFLLGSFCIVAQKQPDCHSADKLLDHISGKYYWGSPKWMTMVDSALHLCSTSAKAWGNKGMIYMMRGDVATWYRCAQRAVEFDPLFYLGNRAWHRIRYLRDYDGALRDLLRQDSVANFYSIYVSDTHNYMLIGLCKEGLGDYEGALYYYNRGLDKQIRERGEGWFGTYDYLVRGILKYKMGSLEEALIDFDRQIESYELLADSYYYRGLVYKKLNRSDEAKRDFEKANDLLNGKGFKRWDSQAILLNEIYQSDVHEALNSLR